MSGVKWLCTTTHFIVGGYHLSVVWFEYYLFHPKLVFENNKTIHRAIKPYSINNNAVSARQQNSSKKESLSRGRVIFGSSVTMDFEHKNQKPFGRRGMR